jgi:HEPN domain-containing protein
MDRNEELRQWFEIADTDLASAEYLTAMRHPRPDQVICFHCQQAAEKYLKGFLFENYIDPPKIHDLLELLKICEKVFSSFGNLATQCGFLDAFSVIPRYPQEIQLTSDDVSLAIKYAAEVKAFVAKARLAKCPLFTG